MLRVDISKIDERIEKLRQLRELAADPDFVTLFQQCLSSNGHRPISKGHAVRAESKRGSLFNAVLEVCRTLAGKFDTGEIRRILEENGFMFRAKNPNIAINGALTRLRKHGYIKVARKGSGRAPSKYVFISDSDRERKIS